MKFRFAAKKKAKKNLIEKIRSNDSFRKIGENDYLNEKGQRFVVSGKHFLVYEACN